MHNMAKNTYYLVLYHKHLMKIIFRNKMGRPFGPNNDNDL